MTTINPYPPRAQGAALGILQANAIGGTLGAVALAVTGFWWWVPVYALLGIVALVGWWRYFRFALRPPQNSADDNDSIDRGSS